MSVKLAIIGGTGVYDPNMLENIREEEVISRYGDVKVVIGSYCGREVAFMPRHGSNHSVPPHKINYRANIWGLKKLGVEKIIATAAVGSLNHDMKPGEFVLVDQFLDFTKGREQTFYEGGAEGFVHIDMTYPYCPDLREVLRQAGGGLGVQVHPSGTYVCTEGPRFETAAEIKMYARLGGDLVGMTSVPEVVLAREAGICYATIAMVTNFAAGISPNLLTHDEVVEMMKQNAENIRRYIMKTIEIMPGARNCPCGQTPQLLGTK